MNTTAKHKQKKRINVLHQIKAKVLTPVSIGDGGQITPLADYYVDTNDNKAYFLNKQAFEQILLNPDHLEAYIKEVNEVVAERKNEALLDFIKRATGKQEKEVLTTYFHPNPMPTIGVKNAIEAATIVKNIDKPYIPGSTLKGALKGVMLVDWLSNTDEGNTELRKLMEDVVDFFDDYVEEFEELDELLGDKVKKWNKINKIKEVLREDNAYINNRFDKVIKRLLVKDGGKNTPFEFNQFRVRDSEVMALSAMQLQGAARLHIKEGKINNPLLIEAISPNSESLFEIVLSGKLKHNGLNYLNSNGGVQALFKRIKMVNKANVEWEKNRINKYKFDWDLGLGNDAIDILDQYEEFLDDLSSWIDTANNNEAYLCIGFGKSFIYNSIGLLAYNWKDSQPSKNRYNSYQKYCKVFQLGKAGQKDFPISRTVTTNGIPLGWVKLELID